MLGRIATIPSYEEVDGTLTCIENGEVIPFSVERFFLLRMSLFMQQGETMLQRMLSLHLLR